jgi:aspartate aminotransferase-like enzyme
VDFADGQDQLKGRVVRIAHIGYVGPFDIITAISALEMALERFGYPVELGRGVAAAERILTEKWPSTGEFI